MTYPSPESEHWYVGAENGPRYAILLGPYPNHSEAAKHVERVRLACQEIYAGDIDATFAIYGVARVISDDPKPGRLNERLGFCE